MSFFLHKPSIKNEKSCEFWLNGLCQEKLSLGILLPDEVKPKIETYP